MLESSESEKPAVQQRYFPRCAAVGFSSLLPPLPRPLFLPRSAEGVPAAGSGLADVGASCGGRGSAVFLGYSEGRFLLPSFQSPP